MNIDSPELYKDYIAKTVPGVIAHLKKTKDDQWITKVTSSKDNKQLCILNHLYEHFEDGWLDVDILYSMTGLNQGLLFFVNDGELADVFPGDTPKERCVCFFERLLSNPLGVRQFLVGFDLGYKQRVRDAEKKDKK